MRGLSTGSGVAEEGGMFTLGLLLPVIFLPLEARKAARLLEEVFGAHASSR